MALITYPLNNIAYSAEDAELYNAVRMSGVYSGNAFDFSVVEGTNKISVGKGQAWINNGEFTGKTIASKEVVEFDFGVAPSAMQRIDVLAIQFDAVKNASEFVIKQGVLSNDPQIPERSTTDSLYELYLFSVKRRSAAVYIEDSDITDLRDDRRYCGYMQDAVKGGYAPSLMEHNKGDDFRVWKGLTEEFDDQLASRTIPVGTLAVLLDEVDPIERIESELAEKAPDGFGLGGVANGVIDDCDTTDKCGFYYTGLSTQNQPRGHNYGHLIVTNREDSSKDVCQIYVHKNEPYVLFRLKVDGVWREWEYLNPPLQFNNEVPECRTIDRFLGKPIYQKLVNLGGLVAGQTNIKAHGANVETMLSCEIIDYTNGRLVSHYGNQVESVGAGRSNIEVVLKSGAANVTTAYAIIRYTKR